MCFASQPVQSQLYGGWEVVMRFEGEGTGPFVIDLSHKRKWDLQDGLLSHSSFLDMPVPEIPGQCVLQNGSLVGRMNRTQLFIWRLLQEAAGTPQGSAFTEITDGKALLALVGKASLSIMEKVSALELLSAQKEPPFLVQGLVLHVPCLVVMLKRSPDLSTILIACSRGYGQCMAEALLDAGSEWGLRPGGELAFLGSMAQ